MSQPAPAPTQYSTLTLDYDATTGRANLMLNRPEAYNAVDETMGNELQAALKTLARTDGLRVVVFGGHGKAFCSGQDLKAIAGEVGTRDLGQSLNRRYNPIVRAIRALPVPVIARVQGVAAGAGCSLVLACDLAIATPEALLIEVFVNAGLVLDSGSSFFLPRIIGMPRAFEMATQATRIGGQQAAEWGLVNKCVPMDELDTEIDRLCAYYQTAPTKAIGMIKKLLSRSHHSSLDDMLEQEAYAQEVAGYSHDHSEGVRAFNEKRKPAFLGK